MATESPTDDTKPRREIPFYRPDIGEEEIAAVAESMRSGWLTIGPRTQEFEGAFAEFVGAQHAVAVNSCTAALHLALVTLGMQPGDEVITTALTFAATGATIVHAGGRPILVDCTDDTLNIDPADVARKLSPRTRAIVPVDFGGHPVAFDEIREIASARSLPIIEDAAHALPASYRGRPVGSLAEMTAFSFYATKNLSTCEGGMLTTDDAEIADRVRCWRLHGMSRDAWRRYTAAGSWRYDVSVPGFKYNMTDPAAAMGLVQLRRLPELHRRRVQLAALYREHLRDLDEITLPVERPEVVSGWHLFPVRFAADRLRIDRDEIIEQLKALGIGTSVHFIPLHRHSYYRDTFGYKDADFPVASRVGDEILSLPFHTRLEDADVEYVAAMLAGIIGRNRR